MSFKQFGIGDLVRLHTQYGQVVGIVDAIIPGNATCPVAVITVRSMSGKPRRYHRAFYKLRTFHAVTPPKQPSRSKRR